MKWTLDRNLVLLVSIAAFHSACGNGRDVDIGHTAAQLSDFAATWDGYAEAKTFDPGGSDRVRLVLDPSGVGTLEVGDGAALPTPTTAEGGYLLEDKGLDGIGGVDELVREGFKFPVHEARVESGRIRLGIDPHEIFGAWCSLTPPFVNSGAASGYSCGPAVSGTNTDDQGNTVCIYSTGGGPEQAQSEVVVDCGIMYTCMAYNPCTCTASACGPRVVPAGTLLDRYDAMVDAAISQDGQTLTGTLAIKSSSGDTSRITVRMQKSP